MMISKLCKQLYPINLFLSLSDKIKIFECLYSQMFITIHNIPIICFLYFFLLSSLVSFRFSLFPYEWWKNNHYKQFMINYDTRNEDSNENVNWHSISFPLIAQSFTFNTIFWHLFDRQSHISFCQSRIRIRISTKKI